MKKQLVIGIATGLIVAVPATVLADRELPWTNNIYNVSDVDHGRGVTVSVFDDQDNKCYVVNSDQIIAGQSPVAISCVKENQ